MVMSLWPRFWPTLYIPSTVQALAEVFRRHNPQLATPPSLVPSAAVLARCVLLPCVCLSVKSQRSTKKSRRTRNICVKIERAVGDAKRRRNQRLSASRPYSSLHLETVHDSRVISVKVK